ncbi:MAG: hypothetical protein JWP52_1273 [Rhizobacter sp.]|nr:hypothetical protein [Rhizobacter sp.]
MNDYSALPIFHFVRGTTIVQAEPNRGQAVTLASPAMEVITDLLQTRAATTPPTASLDQAEQLMIHQGVRLLFVVSEMPSVMGLVTTTDLHGDKPMRVIQQRNVRHADLTVADVMTELSGLDAIHYEDLRSAVVSNVVATLKRAGRRHLLVVEGGTPAKPAVIRALISASQVERQLGMRIDMMEIASSFAEIRSALN